MIECITVGDMIETNSFFYIDDETKHGFLIDAGAEGDRLAAYAEAKGWTIEKLLLTHCHFDHIGAATGGPSFALSMLPKTVRAMRAIRGGTSPYGAARP